MHIRSLSLVLLMVLAACSGGDPAPDAGLDGGTAATLDAGDAGGTIVQPGADAGSADVFHRLSIATTPVYSTNITTGTEKPVSGNIMITRGSKDVTDAVVKLNGVQIPWWTAGLYDVDEAQVPALGPGATVTIEATTTDPPETRTLTFTCPPALDIAAPAANSLVTPNQEVDVTWSPGIPFDAMRAAGGPILGNYACFTKDSGNEVSAMGHGAEFISLTVGQTSQKVGLGDCKRYLLELQYPGKMVTSNEGGGFDMGYCSVRHRVWLRGP